MYNLYLRSILNGNGFQPMFEADKGAGGGSGDKGDGGKGDDKGSGAGDQTNSLDDLMKDPAFKAQYEAKLQEQLGKRLKKFDGVDPDEYKRLKDLEDKKKQDEMTEAQKLQAKIDAMEAERGILEAKERDISIKEYAIANNLDPKLIARLIDKSGIKKSGDDFEGIKEAVEAVQSEFPQLFQTEEGDDHEGQGGSQGGKGGTFNLPKQKGNTPPKKGGYDAGKARAAARHNKQK